MIWTSFSCAFDLCARGGDLAAYVPGVKADSSPAELIRTLHTGAELLATVVAAAPDDARGFHPFGRADTSGFAAMACDELVVPTHGIAHSLRSDSRARTFGWPRNVP